MGMLGHGDVVFLEPYVVLGQAEMDGGDGCLDS